MAKRGWAMSARMRSPRAIVALTRAIGDAAEAREHLEFEELRIVESQPAGSGAQRRRLRLAADAADAEADVNRRALVGGEEAELSTIWPSVIEMRLVGMKAERLPASVSAIGSAVSEPPPSSGGSFAARSSRRACT